MGDEGDVDEEVGDKGDVDDFEEGVNPDGSDADGSVTISESKNSRKTHTPSKARTPIKARWIYPFIKCEIAQTPNLRSRKR